MGKGVSHFQDPPALIKMCLNCQKKRCVNCIYRLTAAELAQYREEKKK